MIATIIGDVTEEKYAAWSSVLHYFEPLQDFYMDDDVTEIMVNRYDIVYIEKNSRMFKVDATFGSEHNLQTFIRQVANALNQEVHEFDYPILDASFPDTSRLCCTMPGVTPLGSTVTLRKAPKKLLTFDDLVNYGSLTKEMVNYIGNSIDRGDCFIVSGNTGSGKTSILRACLPFVPKEVRVITDEDTKEIYAEKVIENCVSMVCGKRRSKSPIFLGDLALTNLRQRPDYPWIGEIREALAANAYMTLINTGHCGVGSTIHSNSCKDTIMRLQSIMATSGLLDYDIVGRQVLSNIQTFIHVSRNHRTYGRKTMEICKSDGEKLITVFKYDEDTDKHIYYGE